MINLDLRYVAGLFDGEGYVYIFKKSRQGHVGYYLSAGITMTHRPILEQLHQQFGGHLNGNRTYEQNPNHRTQFHWGLANSVAGNFIRLIQPFSIVKLDQIDLGLALQDHIDLIGYPKKEQREEVRAFREDLFQKCKAMKKIEFEMIPKKYADGHFGTPIRKTLRS